jgi:RNA polymerase sigma factor (TIGR02999 family)
MSEFENSESCSPGFPAVDADQVRRLYQELRLIARRERRRLPSATLNTTALVHEAWMRIRPEDRSFNNRAHFLGTAAIAMRQLVVDYARHRTALKRGGDVEHVELGDPAEIENATLTQILDIDRALEALRELDERLLRLVELRFFAGLSRDEAAEVLGISPRTAARDWARARALLQLMLTRGGGSVA